MSDIEALMKRCQIGVPRGPNAYDQLHSIIAECYGTLGSLRAQVAALEGDAGRWRYVKSIARQNTAYDYYGNGGLWTIGLHSEDNRLSLDAVADAARKGEA